MPKHVEQVRGLVGKMGRVALWCLTSSKSPVVLLSLVKVRGFANLNPHDSHFIVLRTLNPKPYS